MRASQSSIPGLGSRRIAWPDLRTFLFIEPPRDLLTRDVAASTPVLRVSVKVTSNGADA